MTMNGNGLSATLMVELADLETEKRRLAATRHWREHRDLSQLHPLTEEIAETMARLLLVMPPESRVNRRRHAQAIAQVAVKARGGEHGC